MRESSIDFDTVLDLCRHRHRRIVLGTLTAEQRPMTVTELTEAVLKYNHQTPVSEASEEVRTSVYLSLYHAHLPRLAADGLVDYDPARELVEPTEYLDPVHPTLAAILDADPALDQPVNL